MKVVLFCGGQGMRLREQSESIPKPMVKIGPMPLLWHVMKYYAHFGHKEFILCLGYQGEVIRDHFLHYNEWGTSDLVVSQGGRNIEILSRELQDCQITLVSTGVNSNIGQRLKAVHKYLEGEDVFLANYSDGLTDLRLPDMLDHFRKHDKIADFLCVRPNFSVHFVSFKNGGVVTDIRDATKSSLHINGGYFIFKREIFQYIHDAEELIQEPFQRLIKEKQLVAYKYDGFWAAMDTFKDKARLEDLYSSGRAPWEVWKPSA
ncbi:MAG TPA: sugar phosphate nucleotidyltransferase [Verrucomicrobiae bacterium]|nr:sugar phosphate nucleotidyltransferase [Verrucomicrobiae bacterium]